MKTSRSFTQPNRILSFLRFGSGVTLISAAAAMAFVASGDRLFTVSSPPSQVSQDREAKGKMAGDPDAGLRSARTIPSEGPIGGYEAYKSAARTYPANVIPPSMVQNAKNTFNKIAAQGDPGDNNHWQSYGPIQHSIQPGVLSFSGATNRLRVVTQRSSSRRRACQVIAVSGSAAPAAAFGERTTPLLPIRAGHSDWRSRAELGRRARRGSERLQREHALPRHRRGRTVARPDARRASVSTKPRTAATPGRSSPTPVSATLPTPCELGRCLPRARRSTRSSSIRRTRSTSSRLCARPFAGSRM